MTKKCNRLRGERPKAFWGALVGGAMNLIGGAISSKSQARAIRRQIEAQKEAARTQLELANNSNLASTLNSYAAATRSYNDEDYYNLKYRLGGNKRLGSNRIYITDGGDATKIGNDTYLLRGGSHEQTNETGQTGIGINVGGNEIEAEGGEVAQKKNGALRIFSAQPILSNGMSPAQAILRGYNKDKVFSQQQAFKKINGLKDDGSKAQWGMGIGTNRALQKSTKNGTRSIRSMWNSAKKPLSYTPIVGTAIDGYNLINNPSKTNAVNFGVGLISDLLGYKWLKQAFTTPVRRTVNIAHRGRVNPKVAAGVYSGGAKVIDTELNYLQNKKRFGGRAKAKIGTETNGNENKTNIITSKLNAAEYLSKIISGSIMQGGRLLTGNSKDRGPVNNVAQDTYLMPFRLGQGRAFKDAGYDRDYQSEKKRDYGLVQKAVGNENIPIYSRVNNPEKRKELIQIYNPESTYNPNIKYPLIHAAFHPSSLYIDGTNGNVMYKGWDLNDYGTDRGGIGFSSYYGSIRKALANTLDVFGNPTVVTTGYQNVLDNDGKPMNIFKGNYKDDFNANIAVSDFIVKQLLKKENPSFVNEYGMSPVPEVVITAPRKKHRLGGGLTSKDRGSSKHPYPSVSSKDFAGGGRSYPIPTKADAVDALRLAGLHGRSDVRSKVYSKYPELRKKAEIGTNISLDSYYGNKDFLYRITKGHPTFKKIVNEIFGDESDRRRFIQDLNIFGYGSEDASSIAGASPIFRQPIVSAARQAQFIQDANKARQAANVNKARQAANYAQQQVDYIKELSDRMSATLRNVGEQLGIRVNPNPNNSVRRLYSSNFKPTKTNNRITTPRETPINPSNSSIETPINSTTASATNTPTYSGKTTKFNTKYRSYRNAGFSPRTSKNLVKANKVGLYSTIGGFGTIGAGTLIGANINKTDKPASTQKDAKGKPISPYIARPQEPSKQQTRQIPANVVRKAPAQQPSRHQVKKTVTVQKPTVVPKQAKKVTPQYKGNTTKGNYQLHDGETKIINGIKYTRRGNTIINHKTNVAYIYDKNGNYTGQADYSKVGNFNQAFDAARAAGRSQFIYRAGKYNNYSTNKETDARKERLNRIIGAKRIAKALGGCSRPVKGMRAKFAIGGKEDEGYSMTGELSPVISTARYRTPSFTTVDTAARAIPNFGTIKVPTYVPPSTIPYSGQDYNRSRTIFTGGDYLGLGIDALSALGTGLITSNAYKNLDFNYNLPNFVEESPVALNTTYHNEAQKSNVERNRLNSRNSILRNTMSGSTAVGRMQGVDTNALYQLNQLADEKTNKETELMNQNLLNEQQVRARNAAAKNQYYNTVASIKNSALEAKNNASLARSQAFNTSLSGLSQAWNNFYTSGRTAYEDDQARIAMIASSKDATPTRLIEMGYHISPQVIAALYNTSTDQHTKDFYLSMLNDKQRRKYGIY